MKKATDFSYHLTNYLRKYLPGEIGASKNTIMSYRDTFTLFFKFLKTEKTMEPETVTLSYITKTVIVEFLAWIEEKRNCGITTRNQRLASIHSFIKYIQLEDISNIYNYQQILSIRKKKAHGKTINYISLDGIRLLLEQPEASTMSGRRDLVMLSLMYDSGARVQEIADLNVVDVRLEIPASKAYW